MASVLDYIECPNCKHEASDDFYYKTGEEYINCGNCGYHRSATIVNRDKKLSELTEEDWKVEELKNPYGAYRLKVYHSVATQCGSIKKIKNNIMSLSHNLKEMLKLSSVRYLDLLMVRSNLK